jgi:hypothetical protein
MASDERVSGSAFGKTHRPGGASPAITRADRWWHDPATLPTRRGEESQDSTMLPRWGTACWAPTRIRVPEAQEFALQSPETARRGRKVTQFPSWRLT